MRLKELPKREDIPVKDLNDVLYDFYSMVHSQKKKDHSVQTLKWIHSGLNHFFRKERGIAITSDATFVKANEMFLVVKVNAKKQGRGVKKSTCHKLLLSSMGVQYQSKGTPPG